MDFHVKFDTIHQIGNQIFLLLEMNFNLNSIRRIYQIKALKQEIETISCIGKLKTNNNLNQNNEKNLKSKGK